ncbi:unnamed protein product, partial [marine sediment metagenome]
PPWNFVYRISYIVFRIELVSWLVKLVVSE